MVKLHTQKLHKQKKGPTAQVASKANRRAREALRSDIATLKADTAEMEIKIQHERDARATEKAAYIQTEVDLRKELEFERTTELDELRIAQDATETVKRSRENMIVAHGLPWADMVKRGIVKNEERYQYTPRKLMSHNTCTGPV